MELNPYVIFNGNCREAMNFYKSAFGGELMLVPFADAPGIEAQYKDNIMHASLTSGKFLLLASDGRPSQKATVGENVYLSVNAETNAQVDALQKALGEGGKVSRPASQMFWGAYFAMLTDRFGVHWMLNCDVKK